MWLLGVRRFCNSEVSDTGVSVIRELTVLNRELVLIVEKHSYNQTYL